MATPVIPAAADAPDAAVERVSGTTGALDLRSDEPAAVSGGGTVVAYTASGLQARPCQEACESTEPQVFRRDRTTGATTLVSHASTDPATPSDGEASQVVMSRDGRVVGFMSDATNLLTPATSGERTLYVVDEPSGAIRALAMPAETAGRRIERLSMSADGARVAVGFDVGNVGTSYVAVLDVNTGVTIALFTPDLGVDALALSGDGGTVVYAEDTVVDGGYYSTYVFDVATQHQLIALRSDYRYPYVAVSADGRYVAYETDEDLNPPYYQPGIAVWDRQQPDAPPVPVIDPAQAGPDGHNSQLTEPLLSADGSRIVFVVDNSSADVSGAIYTASPVGAPPQPLLPSQSADLGAAYLGADSDASVVSFASQDESLPGATGDWLQYVASRDTAVLDTHAPEFAAGSALTATATSSTSVHLAWPAATDDISVAGYRVANGSQVLATVGAGALAYEVTDLASATTFQFSVRPLDAASNIGAPLTAEVLTGGELALHVGVSADPLPGLSLQVSAGGAEVRSRPIQAGSDTVLALPDGVFDVALRTSDGDVVASSTGVQIDLGQRVELSLTPERHALLTAHVTAPSGESAGGFTVTVTGSDGAGLGRQDLPAGSTDASFVLPAHTAVTVTAKLDDPSRPIDATLSQTLVTAPGAAAITLTAAALPAATLTIHLTRQGQPIVGLISVGQTVDGRPWSYTATTAADGRVTVPILAGDAQISGAAPLSLVSTTTVTAAPGTSVPVDLDLLPTPGYHIHLHVLTQQAGAAAVEQPLDWRTAVHFGITVTEAGRGLPLLPEVVTSGTEGDIVRLCARGFEGGLSSGCVTATLGADPDVDLTLRLTQAGVVTARLHASDGAVYGSLWNADLYLSAADGGLTYTGRARGSGGLVSIGIPTPGDYVVVVTGFYGDSTGPISVHVDDGRQIDLGVLTLNAEASRDPIEILVSPDPALPGALLGVRVVLPTNSVHPGDRLELSVPSHTAFEPDSPTVAGIAATPAQGDDGRWLIPLARPAGSAALVRFAFTVDRAAPPGTVQSIIRIRHADGSTTEVGAASAQLAGVEVYGPTTVASPTFTVAGTAPAGATVTVYAADEVAGHATAGPGGRYRASVTYAEPLSGHGRPVVAAVTVGGVTLRSKPLYVTYDANAVEPISATIENDPGSAGAASRAITFDPSAGVAAFSVVYVAGSNVITLRFADASRIRDFRAAVGANVASGSCDATTCTAIVEATMATVGDVYVDYDTIAIPVPTADAVPAHTAEQLRHNLPAPLNQATFTPPAAGSATVPMSIPGAFDGTVTVTVADRVYQPTATDRQLAERIGRPFYGLSVTTPTPDTLQVQVMIAADWLAIHPDALPEPIMRLAAISPAADLGETVKVVTWALQSKTTLGILDSLGNLVLPRGDIDELHRYEDLARAELSCAPELLDDALRILDLAIENIYVTSIGMDIVDTLGLFFTLPEAATASLVLKLAGETAVTDGIDLLAKALFDNGKDRAEAAVREAIAVAHCDSAPPEEPLEPPFKRKLASPTYIFDPSGYAYEGVASDRLPGVTATILQAPSPDGPWTSWDASAFGQTSPQLTDADGHYGWDVPKGWYRIQYEKAGYQTAYSEVVRVLPERSDLNVDMLRIAAPAVTGVSRANGSIEIGFDTWMRSESVAAAVSVLGPSGQPMAGSIVAVDAELAPDGAALSRAYVFRPSGGELPAQITVVINVQATDYAGVGLAGVVQRSFGSADPAPPPPANVAQGGDTGAVANPVADGPDSNALADTGVPVNLLVLLAALLVAAGAALDAVGHRRPGAAPPPPRKAR